MSPSLLEVENLSVSYAGVKAVHGISFSVGKAECVAPRGSEWSREDLRSFERSEG